MKSEEQVFWFLSHNKMWCIPLCLAAFSLLPGSYTHAASIIDENTLIVNSTQQQRIVKGTVIDANGEPLIGVNVKEAGGSSPKNNIRNFFYRLSNTEYYCGRGKTNYYNLTGRYTSFR